MVRLRYTEARPLAHPAVFLTPADLAHRLDVQGSTASPEDVRTWVQACREPVVGWEAELGATWWRLGTSPHADVRALARPLHSQRHSERLHAALWFVLPGLLRENASATDPRVVAANAWISELPFEVYLNMPLSNLLDAHQAVLPAWHKRKDEQKKTGEARKLLALTTPAGQAAFARKIKRLPEDFPKFLLDDLLEDASRQARWTAVEAVLARSPSPQALASVLVYVAQNPNRPPPQGDRAMFNRLLAMGADPNPPALAGYALCRGGPEWAWEAIQPRLDPAACLKGWVELGWVKPEKIEDAPERRGFDTLVARLPPEQAQAWDELLLTWPIAARPRHAARHLERALDASSSLERTLEATPSRAPRPRL